MNPVVHDWFGCPECGARKYDSVWFVWGAVPGPDPSIGPRYCVGDRVMWFTDRHGQARGDRGFGVRATNIGDPTWDVVEVRDPEPSRCWSCHSDLGGSVVQVYLGVIQSVRLLRSGEWSDDVAARVLHSDGTIEEQSVYRPLH